MTEPAKLVGNDLTEPGGKRSNLPRTSVVLSVALAVVAIAIIVFMNLQGRYYPGGDVFNSPFDEWWFGAPRTIYGWPIGFTWVFKEPEYISEMGKMLGRVSTIDELALATNVVAWLALAGAPPGLLLWIARRRVGKPADG